ncbi:MAG: NAD-dependent epimerase/dehydratase family protein [Gammaproteobacteria bacterium]|nr:NAD-dependent epimerase/dehydratase family protein [Gammaproteobacteria bacterium]
MPAISPLDGPVAVTGCSGFTGGHMVRELVLQGYQVRACIRDANSWRGKDCVDYLNRLPRVEIVDGCDLFTPGSYHAAFNGCTAVFHTAAVLGNSANLESQPLGSGDTSMDVFNGGVIGTQNIIDAINASSSVRRLLYTSSMAAVRGSRHTRRTSAPDYEWTETDWAYEGIEPEVWESPRNAYARSKVETERLVNEAADASGGRWDAITMAPAMICGPVLFRAQVGQWIEQLGRIAAGLPTAWPSKYDMYYDIIDVRDLVKAERLAAESAVDHGATHGGPRYVMHGTGGHSALRLGTEVRALIHEYFPAFVLGAPATVTSSGERITVEANGVNDCKKAKSVLGATIRPVEDTIRAVIETSIELGVIEPKRSEAPATGSRTASFSSPEDAYWEFFRADRAQDAERWADVMSYPHVRVAAPTGTASFETPEAYASNASWDAREATGWVLSRGAEPVRLHESPDKVHLAGGWTRYNIDNEPILSNRVTYVLTRLGERWGIQARFGVDSFDEGENYETAAATAVEVVERFHSALGSGDFEACARLCHYPMTEVGTGEVEQFEDAAAARERFATMTDRNAASEIRAAQMGSRGVVVSVTASGQSGKTVNSAFLVGNREERWRIAGISAITDPQG